MGREKGPEWFLGAAALAAMIAGGLAGVYFVSADAAQGNVQRLMYVHVPAAWLAFLAFFVVFLMSVLYLIQRDGRWDRVAARSDPARVRARSLVALAHPTFPPRSPVDAPR